MQYLTHPIYAQNVFAAGVHPGPQWSILGEFTCTTPQIPYPLMKDCTPSSHVISAFDLNLLPTFQPSDTQTRDVQILEFWVHICDHVHGVVSAFPKLSHQASVTMSTQPTIMIMLKID